MTDWTRIDGEQARAVLDRLSRTETITLSAEETDVECKALPFYSRYKLYRLTNRATMPAFSRQLLGDGEEFVALNGTANPIYEVGDRDALRLTEATLIPYIDFFFTYVQGSEGEVFFLKEPSSAPFLASLDGATRQSIVDNHRPLELSRDVQTGQFRLSGNLCYGEALISATVIVSEAGYLSIADRSLLLTWSPGPHYHSCFISYSFADEEFATKLRNALSEEGVKTWFAQKDMLAGRKLHEQVTDAIQQADKLLLVLSKSSIQSKWVGTEILEARRRERLEGRQVLFPIRITDFVTVSGLQLFDADEGWDLGREIRQYFIPDFSDWRNAETFDTALEGLLKALVHRDWQIHRGA
jgi:hypothetical protein